MSRLMEKITLLKNTKLYNILVKYRFFLFLICGLFAGFLMVLKDNRKVLSLPKELRKDIAYSIDGIESKGFTPMDAGLGLDKDVELTQVNGTELVELSNQLMNGLRENGSVDEAGYPYIHIKNDGSYINKLRYDYASNGRVEAILIAYNETEQGIEIVASCIDQNNQFLRSSVSPMGVNCTDIVIVFSEAKEFTIQSVSMCNGVTFNWIRFFFAFAFVFTLFCVLFWRKNAYVELEKIFVILAFLIGGSFILAIPTQKVGWDECYHFAQAYRFVTHKDVSGVVSAYMDDSKVWPLNQPQTYEEYELLDQYVDEMAVGEDTVEMKLSLANFFGYLFPGIGIAIGTFLRLSFSNLFVLGKLFSLLFYIVIVYFAIRHMHTGKCLMTMVALMPTCMYMCSIYNRDSVMLAFSFLGSAYLFSLFFDKERRITWKDYFIIMGAFFIVSYLKAVYAPILLLPFLLPKDVFENKKSRYLMLGGTLLVCGLLVIAILVPGMLENGGDNRGLELAAASDAVISHSQQLNYILHHVVTYAKLLLGTIFGTLVDYTVGSMVWEALGHYETAPVYGFVTIVLLFVIITDTNRNQNEVHIIRRVGIFVLLAICIAMVWTSMYMAYTVVGADYINGVQARYYLPVLLPFFLLFNTKKIQLEVNKQSYTKAVMLLVIFMNFVVLYMSILRPYCM